MLFKQAKLFRSFEQVINLCERHNKPFKLVIMLFKHDK